MLHQKCFLLPSVTARVIIMQSYRFLEHNEIQTCILRAVAMANSAENENYSESISWSLTPLTGFLKAGVFFQSINLILKQFISLSNMRGVKTLQQMEKYLNIFYSKFQKTGHLTLRISGCVMQKILTIEPTVIKYSLWHIYIFIKVMPHDRQAVSSRRS